MNYQNWYNFKASLYEPIDKKFKFVNTVNSLNVACEWSVYFLYRIALEKQAGIEF